jgi:lipoprotein-anchoring transpeptidase ErfK/SrfK
MRKLVAFAALAALVAAPAAIAKERNLALTGKPSVTTAGKASQVTITVTRDKQPDAGRSPIVRLVSSSSVSTSSRVVNIVARATTRMGVYRARIVFPSAGTWRVTVIDATTGRAYAFGTTRVLPTT